MNIDSLTKFVYIKIQPLSLNSESAKELKMENRKVKLINCHSKKENRHIIGLSSLNHRNCHQCLSQRIYSNFNGPIFTFEFALRY